MFYYGVDNESRSRAPTPHCGALLTPGTAGRCTGCPKAKRSGFFAPRTRPLWLAEAATDSATPRREPLRSLRRDGAAFGAPCRRGVERARRSPHSLLSLPCEGTCTKESLQQGSFFRSD